MKSNDQKKSDQNFEKAKQAIDGYGQSQDIDVNADELESHKNFLQTAFIALVK